MSASAGVACKVDTRVLDPPGKRLFLIMTEGVLRHNGGDDESLERAYAHKHSLLGGQIPTLPESAQSRD